MAGCMKRAEELLYYMEAIARLGPIYKSIAVALIAGELATRQTELLEGTVCFREARTART